MLSRGSAQGSCRDTEYWLDQKILKEKSPETGKNLFSKLIQESMIFVCLGSQLPSYKRMRVVCMAGR